MIPLEQPNIERPSGTIFPVRLLQKKGILTSICCNLKKTFPEIFKLSMLALFLIPCIPFQHHIIQLKFVCLCFSVINLFNSLLQLELLEIILRGAQQY